MKTQKVSLLAVLVFSTILLTSFISAGFTVSTNTLTFTPGINEKTFIITNTDSSQLLDVVIDGSFVIDGQTFLVTGNKTGINTTSEITITPESTLDFSNVDLGDLFSEDLSITDGTNTEVIEIRLENDNYCSLGNQGGNLDLRVDIENLGDIGEEDDEWYPLDTIRVEFEVENDGSDDIDNVVIEWGLYNPDSGEFVFDEEESDFDLKDGKKETIEVEFTLDPSDLDEDVDDYIFFVKAYSDDLGEDDECTSDATDIKVVFDDDLVALGDIEVPETIECGSSVQLRADVWNIGTDDQEDVFVVVYIPDLDINEKIVVGDIDALEDEQIVFNFDIPSDAEEKVYDVELSVFDEDNDIYESEDTEEESRKLGLMRVEGGCGFSGAAVSAVLESGGKAGQDLVVKATITNTGNELQSYNLNAAGFAEWAESVDLSKDTVVLSSGDSTEVLFTFDVKSGIEGDKTFNIEVLSDGNLILNQPVSVTIEKGFSLSGIFGDNWYLWLIGALNLILVVIIVIVAMKIMKK